MEDTLCCSLFEEVLSIENRKKKLIIKVVSRKSVIRLLTLFIDYQILRY